MADTDNLLGRVDELVAETQKTNDDGQIAARTIVGVLQIDPPFRHGPLRWPEPD